MQRRCSQSACRRVFSIGQKAPVQCPYCGTIYPRVQPDPRSPRDTYGYSVQADFTATPDEVIRQTVCQHRWLRSVRFRPRVVAAGYGLPQREAETLCRDLRGMGIPAKVITTWDAQRQHMAFIRR